MRISVFFIFIFLICKEGVDAQAVMIPNLKNPGAFVDSNQWSIKRNDIKSGDISFSSLYESKNELPGYIPIVKYNPVISFPKPLSISDINSIRLIDARYDQTKVGFLPVDKELQRKGANIIGLQFNNSLTDWMKIAWIEKSIDTDTLAKRDLVIAIQKFWFSNDVLDRYTVANPRISTTLHYHFDVYSTKDLGYFPLKKIQGEIKLPYEKGLAIDYLTDSVLKIIGHEIANIQFPLKEVDKNWLAPADFNDFYSQRIKRGLWKTIKPVGVYATYEDFLNGEPICDSIQIFRKFTNFETGPVYATMILGFKGYDPVSCTTAWGYFNGSSLFVNTGNGFYIKLLQVNNDFIFPNLKKLEQDKIKKNILSNIRIGGSDYLLLKDYNLAYSFTYQLDPDTGLLY